jgi:hypothetical protein
MLNWPALCRFVLLCPFALALSLTSIPLSAQATPARQRTGEFSAFVTYSLVSPEWNGISDTNNGVTFGFEYARFIHRLPVVPSLELRGKTAPGDTVGEHTLGGGIKIHRSFRAFRPYGDFLVGAGNITFTHPVVDYRPKLYVSDNSIVYSAGGGIDVGLTQSWAIRADYQYEWWTIGTNQNFNPRALSFGVVYRIPYHTQR